MSEEENDPTLRAAKLKLLQAQARKAELEAAKLTWEVDTARYDAELMSRDAKNAAASHDEACVYTLHAAVDGAKVRDCMKDLSLWHRRDPNRDIRLVICSPGGSVIDGLALFDYLQELKSEGHYIETVALGWAASMAGVLLQAGDKRIIGSNAFMLIHEVSSVNIGKTTEMEDELKFLKRLQTRCVNILAERSTFSRRQIQNKWKRKDWWLDAEECVKYGFADEIQ